MSSTHEMAPVHFGEPRHTWCPTCKVNSVANIPIYALASAGPYCIGEWSLCGRCGYSPYSEIHNQEEDR